MIMLRSLKRLSPFGDGRGEFEAVTDVPPTEAQLAYFSARLGHKGAAPVRVKRGEFAGASVTYWSCGPDRTAPPPPYQRLHTYTIDDQGNTRECLP